jgi:hypothetical protein
MPVESPVPQPHPKPPNQPIPKPDSERQIGSAKPDPRIRIPSRPRHDGISVNQPRIIRRNVNHVGIWPAQLHDIRALVRHRLLRRGLQIAGILRASAASPAPHPSHPAAGCSRRRPETTSRRGSCPYFPARTETPPAPSRSDPTAADPPLAQSIALQIRMRLHPSVGLDHLLGKRGPPPESAPPANPDTARSALLTAATPRRSLLRVRRRQGTL